MPMFSSYDQWKTTDVIGDADEAQVAPRTASGRRARDQLEYEDFCQSITEFAARFSWAWVLKAVSAAFTAHDQFLERR
jgi:hypothetical protein